MMAQAKIRSILPRRYFTPWEADEILSSVKAHFEIAMIYNKRLEKAVSQMTTGSDRAVLRERASDIRRSIDRNLELVRDQGVEIAGLSPASLDFPAMRNGAPVYLCWRMGDQHVSWWRPMGFDEKKYRKLVLSPRICWEWRN